MLMFYAYVYHVMIMSIIRKGTPHNYISFFPSIRQCVARFRVYQCVLVSGPQWVVYAYSEKRMCFIFLISFTLMLFHCSTTEIATNTTSQKPTQL